MNLYGQKITLNKMDLRSIDLDIYLNWLRDVENNKYISSASSNYSKEELIHYINEKNTDTSTIFMGIFAKDTGTFIGTIKLEKINTTKKSAWLGIMIGDPKNYGKGFGSEAIILLLTYAKNSLKLGEVILGVNPDNINAVNLYNKIGFKFDKSQSNIMVLTLSEFLADL
jgi:RimJ/RimL family protein N-acetyltransferase